MKKINVITLGYCKVETWRLCLEQLKKVKSPDIEWDHYFVYHYYPIDMENNKKGLKEIADENGLIWIAPEKNLGGCEGFNWAWKNYLPDADYILGIDPDTFIETPGFDKALMAVIQDERVGWAGVKRREASDIELSQRDHFDKTINGIDVSFCPQPMMMGTSILKMNWVRKAGGLWQPNNFYGGIEIGSWQRMISAGYQLALLSDYYENGSVGNTQDKLYGEWKAAHAFKGYTKNFDEYLKELGK